MVLLVTIVSLTMGVSTVLERETTGTRMSAVEAETIGFAVKTTISL